MNGRSDGKPGATRRVGEENESRHGALLGDPKSRAALGGPKSLNELRRCIRASHPHDATPCLALAALGRGRMIVPPNHSASSTSTELCHSQLSSPTPPTNETTRRTFVPRVASVSSLRSLARLLASGREDTFRTFHGEIAELVGGVARFLAVSAGRNTALGRVFGRKLVGFGALCAVGIFSTHRGRFGQHSAGDTRRTMPSPRRSTREPILSF